VLQQNPLSKIPNFKLRGNYFVSFRRTRKIESTFQFMLFWYNAFILCCFESSELTSILPIFSEKILSFSSRSILIWRKIRSIIQFSVVNQNGKSSLTLIRETFYLITALIKQSFFCQTKLFHLLVMTSELFRNRKYN
jgi:hypothetical protein